jgi:EAL domain-containing protein (putative c-di-GMP-specific phosphodiesterase class I)
MALSLPGITQEHLLALAMTRAAVLLVIDASGNTLFAHGDTQKLLGSPPADLIGAPLPPLLSAAARRTLAALLDELRRNGTTRPMEMAVGAVAEPVRVLMGGRIVRAGGQETLCLTLEIIDTVALSSLPLTAAAEAAAADAVPPGIAPHGIAPHGLAPADSAAQRPLKDGGPVHRDPETALLSADDFSRSASRLLTENTTDDLSLMLVSLPQLTSLLAAVDKRRRSAVMNRLGQIFSASAKNDNAARLADGLFALVHDSTTSAAAVTETIRLLLGKVVPPGQAVTIGSSTVALDDHALPPEQLTRAFSYTLNQFVANGGRLSQTTLSGNFQEMLTSTVSRMTGIQDFLRSNDLVLAFQPIVWLLDQNIHHQEALTRLKSGESPFAMVTFAEETGFIADLDLAVCRRAIDVLEANPGAHDIAINLSARSLESDAFLTSMENLLSGMKTRRNRLLFELTESARVHDLDRTAGALERLRQQGHQICIDDFGAGAAGLHYVRQLPVDIVKIDGGYVRNITADTRDRALVKSMVDLCRSIGVGLIAEMVETQEQAQVLKRLGITYGQGWHYGRPNPVPMQRKGDGNWPRKG